MVSITNELPLPIRYWFAAKGLNVVSYPVLVPLPGLTYTMS